ncbi:MAG: FAD-dependent oxidoreductase [Negativicutes bacterium]|nr:FAD-dependent oxidoreductase [Negativicutes bacterium]
MHKLKPQKPAGLPPTPSAERVSDPPGKKYDAIVVGAGPAGACAAYFMAKSGLDVLLLERGPFPGAKNCGGLSIITAQIHKLFPNCWEEFEYERIVTSHGYWFLTEDSALAAGFSSTRLTAAPFNRLTVKRKTFYGWLAAKAVEAGATLLLGHHAAAIEFTGGQASGIEVSSPVSRRFIADIILLADGVNSLLAERAGLIPRIKPADAGLYVKETIALPPETIEDRFHLPPGEGALLGLIGYPTAGFNGTASIHTFKDSININVGMAVSDFSQAGFNPGDLLERIKKHPRIQPLLAGGVTTEYGGAMIPEGGYHAIPRLVHPGLMILGDAGSLVNGTHGINLAMWSGYFASQAAFAAKTSSDFSARKLSLYRTLLEESFVLQNMKANAKAAALQQDIPYLFDLYARMANETAYHMATVPTMPIKAKRKLIWRKVTSMQPLVKTVRDAWRVLGVIWG